MTAVPPGTTSGWGRRQFSGFRVADLYAAAGTVDALKAVVDTVPNAKNLYTVSA